MSKRETLIRRCVGEAAAGLGLHFLHMSEGPFSCDAGRLFLYTNENIDAGYLSYYMNDLKVSLTLEIPILLLLFQVDWLLQRLDSFKPVTS